MLVYQRVTIEIVDLPNKNEGFSWIFHSYVNVYQRIST